MFATNSLNLDVRPAQPDDLHALYHLVEQSVRGLLREVCTPRQIESSLKYLFGVDPALIEDGTYYVAEVDGKLAGAAAVRSTGMATTSLPRRYISTRKWTRHAFVPTLCIRIMRAGESPTNCCTSANRRLTARGFANSN
jgi:hypothetical protein